MIDHEAAGPALTSADRLGDQVVTWSGIGWNGYELVLEIRGDSSRPRMLYLDGDLTFIARDDAPLDGDQVVMLRDVGWEGYQKLVQLPETALRPRFLYLDGNLFLTAPSHIHERWVDRLGSFVRELLVELNIAGIPTRETLFERGDDDAGVQPDDSFYIANSGVIAAKGRQSPIDLRVDPPPDLVIEFVHTHPADHAVEILRRLGVPEVWVADKDRLRFLIRADDGTYHEADHSRAFPFLSSGEVFDWVARTDLEYLADWVRALRQWIAEVIVPRVQAG